MALECEKLELSGKGRYTCLDAVDGVLALGATTGSLYFYSLTSKSRLLLEMVSLPEIPGPITCIRLSPPPTHLVAVASGSVLYVLTANFASARERQRILLKSSAHKETKPPNATAPQTPATPPEITALEWDAAGEKLFSGDEHGNIFVSQVAKSVLFASQLLVRMGVRVVQLHCPSADQQMASLVLASDLAKSIIVDLAASKSSQIGRQLRNGPYGACFHPLRKDTVYLARPNMRLWVATATDPKVEKTLKFDNPTAATATSDEGGASSATVAQVKNLGKLYPLGNGVLSWAEKDGLAVLDTDTPSLLQSVTDIPDISDVAVVPDSNAVYVLSGDSSVHCLRQHAAAPPSPPPPSLPSETGSASEAHPTAAEPLPSDTAAVTTAATVTSAVHTGAVDIPQNPAASAPVPTADTTSGSVTASTSAGASVDTATAAPLSQSLGDEVLPVKNKKKGTLRKKKAAALATLDSDVLAESPPPQTPSPSVAVATTPSVAEGTPIGTPVAPVPTPQSPPTRQQQQQKVSYLASKMLRMSDSMKGLIPDELKGLLDKRPTVPTGSKQAAQAVSLAPSPPLQAATATLPQPQSPADSLLASPRTSAPPEPLQPPTDADAALSVEQITERVNRAIAAFSGATQTRHSIEKWLRPWLELWLRLVVHRGVVPDRTEASAELATSCFELRVPLPEVAGDGAADSKEVPPRTFVELLGSLLCLRRCSAACSEWRDADGLRELLPLYRCNWKPESSNTDVFRLLDSTDPSAAAAVLRTSGDIGLLLLVLPELYNQDSELAVALCVEMYPKVLPWHVHEFSYSEGATRKYLGKLFDAHPGLMEDIAITAQWFKLLLEDEAPQRSDVMDPAGAPLLNSDKAQWGHREELMSVVEFSAGSPDLSEALLAACFDSGFWPGLMRLLAIKQDWPAAVDLAVATGDRDSFERILVQENSVALWQSALGKVISLPQSPSSSSSSGIDVTRTVELMLVHAGPISTAEAIASIPGGASGLTPEAISSVIRVGRTVLVDQPSVVRSILSTVDSYLWSKRPWATGPQLRAVAELEASAGADALAKLPFLATVQQQTGKVLAPAFDFAPMPITYEEGTNSHWGVACSSGSTCPICGLMLAAAPEEGAALLLRPGLSVGSKRAVSSNVVVFPRCGHSFHQSCLGNDACILCLKSNLTSLNRRRFV